MRTVRVLDVAGGATPGYRTLRSDVRGCYAAGARAAAPWCLLAAAATTAAGWVGWRGQS